MGQSCLFVNVRSEINPYVWQPHAEDYLHAVGTLHAHRYKISIVNCQSPSAARSRRSSCEEASCIRSAHSVRTYVYIRGYIRVAGYMTIAVALTALAYNKLPSEMQGCVFRLFHSRFRPLAYSIPRASLRIREMKSRRVVGELGYVWGCLRVIRIYCGLQRRRDGEI